METKDNLSLLLSRTLTFHDLESEKDLVLTPRADNVPEYGETFSVLLTAVSGGASPAQPGKLAPADRTAVVTVRMNDDPHGVLGFAADSRQRAVAEDFLPGQENATSTVFTVERQQGLFGEIRVRLAAASFAQLLWK